METNVATVVVDARELVREALKSLMAKSSYRVVCDVGAVAGVATAAITDQPKLVILSAPSSDKTVAEAAAARELWPDSKIVVLYEHALPGDLQKLLTSQVDGCVPMFASPDALIGILGVIVAGGIRVIVAPDGNSLPVLAQPEESHRSEAKVEIFQSDDVKHRPGLSERQAQILGGLVKGYANKVIARSCGMTEATVKVHVKAILQKIRVANRTQAAMWALENGYTAADFKTGPSATPDQTTAPLNAPAIRSVPSTRSVPPNRVVPLLRARPAMLQRT